MREKILIWCALCGLAGVATSCVSTQKSLYSWENYEKVSYDYSKDQTDQRLAKLDECFDKMTAKQKGTRKTVPPGIFAEKAYLLVKKGKKHEALAMLDKEIELYPESKPFIDKIKKQIEE